LSRYDDGSDLSVGRTVAGIGHWSLVTSHSCSPPVATAHHDY
jgi:hypothetical protein